MKYEKSVFETYFSVAPEMINNLVQGWLSSNGFYFQQKFETNYFQKGDGMITAIQCFEYFIEPNKLTVYAYLKNPKKPIPLDNKLYASALKNEYKNDLQLLFQQVSNMSAQSINVSAAIAQGQITPDSYQYNMQMQTGQALAAFEESKNKKNGSCAIFCLVVGIIDVLIGLFGFTFGIYITICAIFLGVKGLNSNKKGLSIAGLILTGVSLVLFFVTMRTGAAIIQF
ncbi:MAG: hypothetical protein MJ105_09080 [Lachnospiraceae bacterium]|nr:hypothetical protein [Lachnospiraceae bacterium]